MIDSDAFRNRYVYIYTKSYQEFDHAESSVVTKIKGLMYARGPEGRTDIWDSIDFVVPAQVSLFPRRNNHYLHEALEVNYFMG